MIFVLYNLVLQQKYNEAEAFEIVKKVNIQKA